jgi:hypothetical protein
MWSPAFATPCVLKERKLLICATSVELGNRYFAYAIFKHLDATNTKILHANGVAQSRLRLKSNWRNCREDSCGQGYENRNVVYSVSKLRLVVGYFARLSIIDFFRYKRSISRTEFYGTEVTNCQGFDLHNGEHVFIPKFHLGFMQKMGK